jgi:hypothetical protein
MSFSAGFRPCLNKQGLNKLTFTSFNFKTFESKKEGKGDYDLFSLCFTSHGFVMGVDQEINCLYKPELSPDSLLGEMLLAMGFVFPETATVTDDDGFAVAEIDEDDDGFGVVESVDVEALANAVTDFLEEQKEKKFVAKVAKNKNGFWEIEKATLAPLSKK